MQGNLFIVSAPSGAGKTSLVRALLESDADLELSISHTTRPPRPGEENGVDYHFVNEQGFHSLIDQSDFLEYARVFDHFYGTSRRFVEARLDQGRDVLLEIDWQGALQVRSKVPASAGIFILPPSREVLETRLRGRGQDSEDVIARRMEAAVSEISHYGEFDYLIINDDFDRAVADLRSIIYTYRLRQSRQADRHHRLLADLLA